MIRVFVDATVLFSAARNPDGMNRGLLNVSKQRGDVLLLSNWLVIDEADIKLMYLVLRSEREELKRLVAEHINKSPVAPVELNQALDALTQDPNDVPVIAGAVFAEADWLVSANVRHFGHLYDRTIRGVLVLSPEAALRRLVPGAAPI
ncbi:MAG: PIN domain-containing protein [Rubrobacteraceae bacterium]|nr:PIN domain-containing protein [Rubrobacteraceae bacterium]